jgi:carbon storage regulator
MLVLSRKRNEEIVIGGSIRVKLVKMERGRVCLGVSAPRGIPIRRAELMPSRARAFCRQGPAPPESKGHGK